MKAVNLLPADLRRAGSSGGSGSGAGAYALLAALGLLVVVAATWAVSTRQVNERRADVTRLTAEAQAAEAQASVLEPYIKTVQLADERLKTVSGLAKGRFDWASALREVSLTVPKDAWITTMSATTSPAVTIEGDTNPLRADEPTPAITVVGCTPTQQNVATLMTRLRAMDGVSRVALATSEKADEASGSAAGDSASAAGSKDGDCRQGSDRIPKFNLVVFYEAAEGAAAATAAGGATAATSATPAPAPTGDVK